MMLKLKVVEKYMSEFLPAFATKKIINFSGNQCLKLRQNLKFEMYGN